MLANTMIRTRLALLVIAPLLVLTAVIVIASLDAQRINNNLDHLFNDRMKPISQLKVVSDSYAVSIVDTLHKYRAGIFDEPRLHREFDAALQRGNQAWDEYRTTRLTDHERQLVGQVDSALATVRNTSLEFIRDADSGKLRAMDVQQFNSSLYGAFDPLGARLSELIELQLSEGQALYVASEAQYRSVVKTFLLIGAGALVALLAAALLISLSIIRPLSGLRTLIMQVQQNSNLTLRAEVAGQDEVSDTARAFNALIEHQHSLILELAATASQLSSASEEMSAISAQVSHTATMQGDQTHMVAAAVHEMSVAVQEVANNALATAASAADTNRRAGHGSALVHASVESIQGVSLSVATAAEVIDSLHVKSEEISKVLGVIQSIAAQTNLLALNAAIEAARAGEAGRGFAVVADEVRGLASNTQTATETIRSMIEALQQGARAAVDAMHQSRAQVQACVQQSREAGDALNYITDAIELIASGNEQVSTATEEQTSVANEISENVSQLNSSIAEVVNGAQHSLSASRDLAQMASRLQQQAQRFVV